MCDRSRDDFCWCRKCTCNESVGELHDECKSHCNIKIFWDYAWKSKEYNEEGGGQNSEEVKKQECVINLGMIISFCGNVIGIGLLVAIVTMSVRYYRIKRNNHEIQNTQKPSEVDSLILRKDSGINEESGEESGTSVTTLKDFNTRRILTNAAQDGDNPFNVLLVSGRHNEVELCSNLYEDKTLNSENRGVLEEFI